MDNRITVENMIYLRKNNVKNHTTIKQKEKEERDFSHRALCVARKGRPCIAPLHVAGDMVINMLN